MPQGPFLSGGSGGGGGGGTIGGSGTLNTIPRFTSATAIGDSPMTTDGTNVLLVGGGGIAFGGNTASDAKLLKSGAFSGLGVDVQLGDSSGYASLRALGFMIAAVNPPEMVLSTSARGVAFMEGGTPTDIEVGAVNKLAVSGTNGGTMTLYDDTAVTGASQLNIRTGAADAGGNPYLFQILDSGNNVAAAWRVYEAGAAVQIVTRNSYSLTITDGAYRWGEGLDWNGTRLASDYGILWNSGTNIQSLTPDIGLARASAGVLKVTDGSSGYGALVVGNIKPASSTVYIADGLADSFLEIGDDAAGGGGAIIGIFGGNPVLYTARAGITLAIGSSGGGGAVQLRTPTGYDVLLDPASGQYVKFSGSIVPATTATYDIGDSTHFVRDLYVGKSIQGWSTKVLTESSDTGFVDIPLAQNTVIGGYVEYVVRTTNGTDYSVESGQLFFTGASKTNGTVDDAGVGLVGTPVQSTTAANTFTNQFTVTKGTNKITLNCQSDSTLTSTDTITLFYRVHLNGAQTETITGL